jgi:hypothetical protein
MTIGRDELSETVIVAAIEGGAPLLILIFDTANCQGID